MSAGQWMAIVLILFFGSATAIAIWTRERTSPEPEPDLSPEVRYGKSMFLLMAEHKAAESKAKAEERAAVLRDRQVKEEILAELKAARADQHKGKSDG